MKNITIWTGSDLFRIIDIPFHTSAKQAVEVYLPELEEMFGEGVELKRANDERYEVCVDHVTVA